MTVPVSSRRAGPLACNGAETDFDFAFKVFTTADVAVILTDSDGAETTLVLDSDYTVVLNGDQESNPGGTITTIGASSPYAAPNTITMIGALTYKQGTAITNLGGFLPSVIMGALDYLAILIQQLKELTDRSLRLPASATGASTELPVPEASTFIGWNSLGTALVNYAGVASAAVSSAMAPVVAAASLALGRAALGATAVGEALFTAASAVAARATLGAAASGAVTGSGNTMTTAKLLGRTTAGTGAIEEISVGSGLAFSGGSLSQTTATPVAASQAEQEAGSLTSVYTTPGRQHFHPSAAKAWVNCDNAGAVTASYNVSSVTDVAAGRAQANFTNNMSSASYAAVACSNGGGGGIFGGAEALATGSFELRSWNTSTQTLQDSGRNYGVVFGDI